jgi:hypothetical protein
MSAYRVQQRRLTHRGREFHFVSYEGQPANPARDVPEQPPTWFLMQGGKRWPVMPEQPEQDEEAVDRDLVLWLEAHVFATA